MLPRQDGKKCLQSYLIPLYSTIRVPAENSVVFTAAQQQIRVLGTPGHTQYTSETIYHENVNDLLSFLKHRIHCLATIKLHHGKPMQYIISTHRRPRSAVLSVIIVSSLNSYKRLSFLLAQSKNRSDWADVQADLIHRWLHMTQFCGSTIFIIMSASNDLF